MCDLAASYAAVLPRACVVQSKVYRTPMWGSIRLAGNKRTDAMIRIWPVMFRAASKSCYVGASGGCVKDVHYNARVLRRCCTPMSSVHSLSSSSTVVAFKAFCRALAAARSSESVAS